jgi:hypothetical protein
MVERTKDKLAAVLRAEGLTGLAERAASAEFDDFESEHTIPIGELVKALHAAGRADLARRAMAGEWDGTKEEAEAWARKEGLGDTSIPVGVKPSDVSGKE